MIQIGINGFGRIGRVILRACLLKSDLEITAINDPAIDVHYICYLIKFDSTHGKFDGSITPNKDEILVNDKQIKIFHEKLPANIPWQTAGVQYVIEASGMFTTIEKASGHLASETVRRVILTAPSVDIPMLVLGVNDDKINASPKVVSCTSSTLYCLAPIIKVLEDSFGLAEGFVTSIHAMTPSLKPLDGLCLRGKHWRDHRSIHQNIIPAMTGACKALGMIMPRVKDKLCGLAFRVPIVNVSVLDLTIRLKSHTSLQEILRKVEKASNRELKNIIRISKENAVSSDFIGETHSCILDADSSLQLKTNFFKLVCWYENEYSYACRVIDTIAFSENDSRPLNVVLSSVVKRDRTQQTECCRKDILGSTSHDTGLKYKTQQLIFKKPLSTQLSCNKQALLSNKDSKKKSEFFKIWNDEKAPSFKPSVNQKRTSFFHSCVAITPRNLEEVSAVKAQDRLEMLKKEFSKMVNVTESLLKKSYTDNFSVNSDNKSINRNSERKIDGSLGKSYETLSDVCNMTQSNRMFGDCNSDFSSGIDKSLGQESDHKKLNNISLNDVNEKVTCDVKTDNVKSKVEYIKAEDPPIPEIDNKSLNTQSTTVNKVTLFKLNSLSSKLDGVNNVEENSIMINKHEDNTSKKVVVKQEEIHTYTANAESSNMESEPNKETLISVRISKNLISELKLRSNKTESKWQSTIKENLNKLKYPEKCAPLNQTLADINVSSVTTDSIVKNVQLDGNNIEPLGDKDEDLNRSFNFDRISTGHYSYVSDRKSLCGSPCNTSVTASNAETYRHKDDIYDKLDSISGSDSNNSFQIHERKSQVIDLSDLTNSIEDLGRLDKICKIIEISDDLSNKLFSPLDNSNCGIQTKKKTWSFKDLCERIKLDDFCENVFGKSSS